MPFFVALTESGKYKFFSLIFPFIPLFTRIKKDEALDQFVRGRVFGYIESHQGTHYSDIMDKIGVGNGTLSHHLYMLEKMDMIKSRREGLRYRAFYTTGVKFPEKDKWRLTELQSEIMKIIKENEGISQKDVRTILGETQQTINYNIKMLQRSGLIELEKKGRITYCYTSKKGE